MAKPNKSNSTPTQIEVVGDEFDYEIQIQWPDQPPTPTSDQVGLAVPGVLESNIPIQHTPSTVVSLADLSRVCNTPFTSPESAIEFIRSLCVLSVNGITITIDPNPWERFMSRNVGAVPAEQYAQEQIAELVNEWVGW